MSDRFRWFTVRFQYSGSGHLMRPIRTGSHSVFTTSAQKAIDATEILPRLMCIVAVSEVPPIHPEFPLHNYYL